MPRRMAAVTGAMLVGAMLGGCNPLAGFAPTETELLTAGTVPRDHYPPGPTVYCYRTLAEVDCYRTAQSAEASRLVGSDPPME